MSQAGDAGLERLPCGSIGSPGSRKFRFCWRKSLVPGWIFTLREAELESQSRARKEKLHNRSGEEGRPGSKTTLLHLQEGNWEKARCGNELPKIKGI